MIASREKRRRLQIAVLGFGVLFVIVLVFSFRPGRRPSERGPRAEQAPPAGADGQATTLLSGVDFTESLRGKPLFRIQSEKTVGFGPGAGLLPDRYALEKVTLTVYTEDGKPVVVSADSAEYDARTKAAKLTGNVRWADEDGAVGETARVEFDPRSRTLVIPSEIHLVRGTFDLRATSGRYEVAGQRVTLKGPIRGSGTGEGSAGLSAISADEAIYRRAESVLELAGHVSAESREGGRLETERLTLKLAAEGGGLEWARAEDRVRGAIGARPEGVRSAPAGSAGPTRYAADQAVLFFSPPGVLASLRLTAAPALVEQPDRRITASTIEVAFREGRAFSAAARGDVKIHAKEGTSESESANLSFAQAGSVETLELTGSVRISGDGRAARAARAIQIPARRAWILTGDERRSATVESGGSRISAARIELSEEPRGVRAEGGARAVFTQEPGKSAPPTLVGDSREPTYGKADRIVLDDPGRLVTLSGRAALWQGPSSLSADDISIHEGARTLTAVGTVRAILARAEPASEPKGERAIVTARRMTYREAEATAAFEGGVEVRRGTFRASGERAVAHFGKERRIERVELSGDVRFADAATGRSGSGQRLVDFPGEEKTVLEGSPARVEDGEGNRLAGAVLTVTGRGRTVEVTAPEGGRTETIHRTRPD